MITIRPVRADDLHALYDICLKTGDSGGDASGLHAEPRLLGEIYAAPYAVLEPDLALVAEDDQGVAAYMVGTVDTRAFEARCEAEWWPSRREIYADPRAGDVSPKAWTPDQWRALQIHRPYPVPEPVVTASPAHLHINLLPRLQGQGIGRRLIGAWTQLAQAKGARSVHLGCSAANARALRFYDVYGFRRLPQEQPDTIWMVRDLP